MTRTSLTRTGNTTTLAGMRRTIARSSMMTSAAIAIAGTCAGCVNVTAPDKPIQINLNISVTAETVVKFDAQAKSLIQQNPGIF